MPIIIKKKNGDLTITGTIPAPAVNKFKCMLAASEIPAYEELTYPLMASYKLDGIRSPITGGVAMSRKMLPLPNRSIQKWVKDNAIYLDGLDGEMIVGPPNTTTTFNTTTSGVMKADGNPEFSFHVFEIWSHPKFTANARDNLIEQMIERMPYHVSSRVVHVEQRMINNEGELRSYYADALSLGYEGLILKSPFNPYKFGRSTLKEGTALKFKEFIDYNCVIKNVKQGKTNTNEKVTDELGHAKRSTAKAGKVPNDEVGGFVVECIDPESVYYGMEFNCGPGSLTQDDLRKLWGIRGSLLGQIIRVKSQKLGGKTLPRFPSWYGWVSAMNTGEPS